MDNFSAFCITHSLYVVFYFIIEGIGSGVRTICANAIGALNYDTVKRCLVSSWKVSLILAILTSSVMVCYPGVLIELFKGDCISSEVDPMARSMLIWAWLAFLVDGLWTAIQSMLTAAGDTGYPMFVNLLCYWMLEFFPIYIIMGLLGLSHSAIIGWYGMIIDMSIRVLLLYFRYKTNRWRKLKISAVTVPCA
jgi:Na+-driven multidrug efflux pump